MAVSRGVKTVSGYKAEGDISASQFCALKVGTVANGLVVAGAGDQPVGILYNKPSASGQPVELCIDGIAKVAYGGTVADGDWVKADASGKAVTTTTTGDKVIGKARKAGASGDTGEVLLDFTHVP